MRDVSATETAVIYGLEPIWGAGFAWFLLGERWGMAGWIGAALILGKIQFLSLNFFSIDLLFTDYFQGPCFLVGGSLTVQIFESWSHESRNDGNVDKKSNLLMVSDNLRQVKKTSTSTVVASSKEMS